MRELASLKDRGELPSKVVVPAVRDECVPCLTVLPSDDEAVPVPAGRLAFRPVDPRKSFSADAIQQLVRQSVVLLLAHAGFEGASNNVLDVFSSVWTGCGGACYVARVWLWPREAQEKGVRRRCLGDFDVFFLVFFFCGSRTRW